HPLRFTSGDQEGPGVLEAAQQRTRDRHLAPHLSSPLLAPLVVALDQARLCGGVLSAGLISRWRSRALRAQSERPCSSRFLSRNLTCPRCSQSSPIGKGSSFSAVPRGR